MTPSRPAPSKRVNQSAASATSVVAGVRWMGACGLAEGRLEQRSSSGLRLVHERAVIEREEVPGDERGR